MYFETFFFYHSVFRYINNRTIECSASTIIVNKHNLLKYKYYAQIDH